MFHFTCFNVEDPNDPSVGLVDGQLSIPGNLLRREVFDPVIAEVHDAISSPFVPLTCSTLVGIATHRGSNTEGRSKHSCVASRGRICRKRIFEATGGGSN